MSATPWSGRVLSLDEWDAMPVDDSRRYELAEGVLQVVPSPTSDHQGAAGGILYQLMTQLTGELRVRHEMDVLISTSPPIVRKPDLIVVSRAAALTNPARFRASDVSLAVEMLSPATARTDMHVKFEEYAEAGIENYWVVDLDPPLSLASYRLVDDEYKLDFEGAGVVELDAPAPVTLDLVNVLP